MTGASTDMLKAFGGHATSKEVERYTKNLAREPQGEVIGWASADAKQIASVTAASASEIVAACQPLVICLVAGLANVQRAA